jgi:hypothetical protein
MLVRFQNEKMMCLWFWLWLLSFGLYCIVKKSKIDIKFLVFSMFGLSIEALARARIGAALYWCSSCMKKWCGSGSGVDTFPKVYIVNKAKIYINFLICSLYSIGQRIGVGAGARIGAALCRCGSSMKKLCGSGSGVDTYPKVYCI